MRKTLTTLLTLISLLALNLISCQKDTAVTTSFTATLENCTDDEGKTAFTNDNMQWVSGDRIKVFGTAGSGVYEATVRNAGGTTFNVVSGDAGSAPYRAVYPASAANEDGTVELPVVQVTEDGSLTGFPMYTQGSSTNLNFKNLCGVLRMRLQKSGVSITAIEVTGDIELTGDFNVAYNSGVPTLSYSDHGTKTTMMTCATPQNIATQKDFYIFLPVHTYSAGMRIRIYSSDGGVCTKTVSAGHSVRIQRSKITTITLSDNSLTFAPNAGALPGSFTIDAEGHQVRFSQGNLQYTTLGTHAGALGSNMLGIWHFAPEQYECLRYDNEYISDTCPKWIDLFGWGTGNNPTHNVSDYHDYTSFVDWSGNAISNGGNAVNQWRTLTKSEWYYIVNTRSNITTNLPVSNARYAKCLVNGIQGLVLFPDGYYHPATVTAPQNINNARATGWDINIYTQTQWAEMEAAGAVFLPVVGYRAGTEVRNPTLYGMYWASTPDNMINYAQSLSFTTHFVDAENAYNRSYGFSVRPVWDNN